MRNLTLAIMMAITVSGCSAAKSAVSTLTGGKPNQTTVVTHVEPRPVVVNVQPVVQPAKRERRFASLEAMALGAGAGALLGYAVGGKRGAAIGAGTGAVGGVVARELTQ